MFQGAHFLARVNIVKNGGELEHNDASISGSNLAVDSTGILDINSTVSLSGNLPFAMTDEAGFSDNFDLTELLIGEGATSSWRTFSTTATVTAPMGMPRPCTWTAGSLRMHPGSRTSTGSTLRQQHHW